jgi:ABC-type nitrate/sulfonate/bicarbonate transport system ATPase subunit
MRHINLTLEYKMIELHRIYKDFGDVSVLGGLSLHVRKGELVSVLGPSGCGKSTLMNIICGLASADAGRISVNGRIGYMQQKDLLLPWETIIGNVTLPKIIGGTDKKQARDEALPYFAAFGLDGYEHSYPYELSGGMKQRANFLRTFLMSGDIMLLDEPFGALDSITRSKLQTWLIDMQQELKLTIMFITHDTEEAILLSDRIYVLSEKPSNVKKEIELDFPEDGKRQRLISPRFIYYKKLLLENL